MRLLLPALACGYLLAASSLDAQIVFSTDFSDPATISFTGSGGNQIRTTASSANYLGASGGNNVFLTDSENAFFQINTINIPNPAHQIELTFGAYKNRIADDLTNLKIDYSLDSGLNWIELPSLPAQPTGSGTANWRELSVAATGMFNPSQNLSVRFTNLSSDTQYRLDDLQVSLTAIPEPSTYAAILGALALGLVAYRRRKLLTTNSRFPIHNS